MDEIYPKSEKSQPQTHVQKVSIPTPRSSWKQHAEIKRKIASEKLSVGKDIALKSWIRNKISESGKPEDT